MELSLLLMNPLPARLPGRETIKLILRILDSLIFCAFPTITRTTKEDSLARAGFFYLIFYNLVDSCSNLITKINLALPKANRMVFEVFTVLSLEGFYGRFHLLLEFENYVSTETFAQLSKFLNEAPIVPSQ